MLTTAPKPNPDVRVYMRCAGCAGFTHPIPAVKCGTCDEGKPLCRMECGHVFDANGECVDCATFSDSWTTTAA